MRYYDFYVYITTNPTRTVLYTGATNPLQQRLTEHYLNFGKKTFAGEYHCFNLIYYEEFQWVRDAFAREHQIKSWKRSDKIRLIESVNPTWRFLNSDIMKWPPSPDARSRV